MRVYSRKKTRKHNDFDGEKNNILKSTDIRANECVRLVQCAYMYYEKILLIMLILLWAFFNNATPEYYILYSAKSFQKNRLNWYVKRKTMPHKNIDETIEFQTDAVRKNVQNTNIRRL